MSEKKQRPYKHPQINLRIPEELKEKIQELADKNGRSMNAEIVNILKSRVELYPDAESKSLAIRKIDLDGKITIDKAELMSIHDAIMSVVDKIPDKK